MNDHAYPSDWSKPKFFFGQKVSLACLPDPCLWYGFIRGMHYSKHSCHWNYEVLISPSSFLLDAPDVPEILIVWHEDNMILAD